MLNYFETIYRYNEWANERVLDCIRAQNIRDERIYSWFAHSLVAQLFWLNRILLKPAPEYKLWGTYDLGQLIDLNREANRGWKEFVQSGRSFDSILHYTNNAGDKFSNQISMIMIHVVNHGTYHRGQIAARIRELGYEPVNTDFIMWDRYLTGQVK